MKWGIRFLQGFLIGLGLILLGIGTYILFEAFQEWFINAPVYVGFWSTTQEMYQYSLIEFLINKLNRSCFFYFIPGGSLIFFGVMVGWISRMLGYEIKIIEKVSPSDIHKNLRACFNCGGIYPKTDIHCPYCCKKRRGE